MARILKSAIAPHRGGSIILFEVFDMPNKRQALFTLIWVVVNEVTMAFAALGFCALHCAYDPLQEHSSTSYRWMSLGIITF